MSVFKRKSIHGETREFHYKFMQAGKWYYGVCEGCTGERDALNYEKKIREVAKEASQQKNVVALVENFKQELVGGTEIPLTDAYAHYAGKPRAKVPGVSRERVNRQQWENFVLFMHTLYADVTDLGHVTRRHAEAYIAEIRRNGRFDPENHAKPDSERKRNLISANTVNAYHKQCRSVFAHLREDAGLLNNPFDFPLQKSVPEGREAFTMAELKKINDHLDDFVRPIFRIGICTGLSEGDICLLRWSEIHDGWISGKKRRKTGAALEIPILPPLADFLAEQYAVSGTNEFVLPEHAAMYQGNPSGISYRVKQFLEKLRIKTTRKVSGRTRAVSIKDVHSLRHTFAYLAGCYQIPLPVVQSVLGHMSPEMTKHYQAHADREAKEKYLTQLSNVLGTSNAPRLPAPEIAIRQELTRLVDQLPLEELSAVIAFIKSRAVIDINAGNATIPPPTPEP